MSRDVTLEGVTTGEIRDHLNLTGYAVAVGALARRELEDLWHRPDRTNGDASCPVSLLHGRHADGWALHRLEPAVGCQAPTSDRNQNGPDKLVVGPRSRVGAQQELSEAQGSPAARRRQLDPGVQRGQQGGNVGFRLGETEIPDEGARSSYTRVTNAAKYV